MAMDEKAIAAKMNEILLDILDVDEADIKGEASFQNDLGVSSVDLTDIIAAMENEFDIRISDDEVQKLETVQNAIDYLKTKTA